MSTNEELLLEKQKIEKELKQLENDYNESEELEFESLAEEIMYEECRDSLHSFVVHAWDKVDSTEFVDGWLMEAITLHLEALCRGQIKDLLIEIPPRSSKTLTSNVMLPAWDWIANPQEKIWTVSYNQRLSEVSTTKSRRLLLSDWYQKGFGNSFKFLKDQNQKARYENDKDGFRMATTPGGFATGTGYDLLIADDVSKPSEIHSQIARSNITDWWANTMASRANDPKTARRLVIAQRLHEQDLIGHIKESEDDWTCLTIPMLWEADSKPTLGIGWVDPRKRVGQVCNPDRFTEDDIDKIKRRSSWNFEAQYQQQPTAIDAGIIKKSWLKYYAYTPDYFDKVLISWDLSFGGEQKNDYSVGSVWGRKGADKYLLDLVRGHWEFNDQIHQIRNQVNKFSDCQPTIICEDRANGRAAIDTLKREIPRILPIQPNGSKESRVMACAPDFEAGNIYLPDPKFFTVPWLDNCIAELTNFPRGRNDDIVDSFSQVLNYFATSCKSQFASIPYINHSDTPASYFVDVMEIPMYKRDGVYESISRPSSGLISSWFGV